MPPYPSYWNELATPDMLNKLKANVFQSMYKNIEFPISIWNYLTEFKIYYGVMLMPYPEFLDLIGFYDANVRFICINPYYLAMFARQLGASTVQEFATFLGLPTHTTIMRCLLLDIEIPRWGLIKQLLKAGAPLTFLFVTGVEKQKFVDRFLMYKKAVQGEELDFDVAEKERIIPFISDYFEQEKSNSTYGK